jgi:hypothetical protein
MSRALHILLGILLAALVVPSAAAAEDDGPDRIVVKRRTGLTAAERADIRQDAGVTLEATLPLTGVEVVIPTCAGRRATSCGSPRPIRSPACSGA